MHLTIGHTIEFEIIETVKSCAYGDAIVLDTAYVKYDVPQQLFDVIVSLYRCMHITIRFAQ